MPTPDDAKRQRAHAESLLDRVLKATRPPDDDAPFEHDPARPPQVECPQCHSRNVLPIVYGLPGRATLDQALLGLVELGGCCITGRDPTWCCSSCRHCWGNLRDRDWRHRAMMQWIDDHYEPLSDQAREAWIKKTEAELFHPQWHKSAL